MKKVQNFFWQSSFIRDNGNITLGAPAIEGASVEAKVLQHLKGDKVIVSKKKKKKRIQKRNGHRQYPPNCNWRYYQVLKKANYQKKQQLKQVLKKHQFPK
jgi:hypothetical protein